MSGFKYLLLLSLFGSIATAGYRAGVARVRITPAEPVWMGGYAARTHASTGVMQDLWAKALAIDNGKGQRVVILTTDLIGMTRPIADLVSAAVIKQFGLERSQLLINSSHTHSGPALRENTFEYSGMSAEDVVRQRAYIQHLQEQLTAAAGQALDNLQAAEISYAEARAGFAANRRAFDGKGKRISGFPAPVDHSVPVIKVTKPGGGILAVLFGYACHNTTLTSEFYQISGDYAGYAQQELERDFPGSTALFLLLCGADQNPYPRSQLELAQRHGHELALAVQAALQNKPIPIRGEIRSSLVTVQAPLQPHSREQFEKMRDNSNAAFRALSRSMLEAYERRRSVQSIPLPVQAIRFGNDLVLVGLGGEPVVDYGLQIKREYSTRRMIVAGYSNDVPAYIPTLRVLHEGGYEGGGAMVYFGWPSPFTEEIENVVMGAVRASLKRIGINP